MNHPMLHHGVAYACLPSDEAAVEALTSLGPYDRLKQGMLCEQFFMVRLSYPQNNRRGGPVARPLAVSFMACCSCSLSRCGS